MTEEKRAELIKEVIQRGYTIDNFICLHHNVFHKEHTNISVVENFTSDIQLGIFWGNRWVMINNKWAEFKDPSNNLYPIY